MKRTGQSKIAVVGWGRGMGHKGHMYLADAVITQAQAMNADPYFFVSKTVGKDDPIFPEEKVRIYQKVFPQHATIFTPEGNLNQALTELATLGYQGVIVVVGADQKQAFQYLEKPNKEGVPVYQSMGLQKLRVISRQETNSKFANEEGPRATPMREILLDPNSTEEQKFATWRRDMPEQLSDREVLDVMNKAESRLLQLSAPKSVTKVQSMSKKQTKLKESLIMDRNAKINAFYVATTGKKHKVAEGIPYYLLDNLVSLLTKKYNITMNDIEVRPADKTQYRRSGLPELAEGVLCNPNEVAELLYNAKPEIFSRFGDDFVMDAITQACEQHTGSAQEVAVKVVEILKQGITETALQGKDDLAAKRKALQDLEREPGVDQAAVRQRKLDLEKEARSSGLDESPEEALKYATQAHAGQTRSGGDPYISHPVRVANHIKQFKQSHNLDALISAAYLHDTIEDTDTTQEILHDLFGGLVASLVKELTSDPEEIKKVGKAQYLSHKMAAMSSYALVIKLADRLDNVKDITTARTPQWRAKYAQETNQILNYIEKTRALSGTHNKLIELIRAKLAEIDNPQQGVEEGSPIVVMPSPERLKKAEPKKVDLSKIGTPTKPPSTEKRGVKGRPGQRPMPQYEQGVAEEGITRRGILKGIGAAAAAGAAGKASAIAGAFPTPSHQAAMYKAAADSNRAMAAQEVERQRQANAAKASKLAADTKDVERLNKVNYHGGNSPKPTNATWDGDSDFLDLDGTQYTMASRMPISGNEPRDMQLIATKEGHQVYIWTRYRMKGDGGHYFYPAEKPNTINEFAPGNGDDGIPHAEYQVYQCNPEDQFDWIGGPLYQTDSMGMAHKYAYEQYVKHRPKAFMVWQEHTQGSRGNYGVKGESDHDESELKEDSQVERKITRIQSMIQDFHNRAKATKNDTKKNHYLQMADQLQTELDRLINDANEQERDGNMVAQHDSESSDTWNRGGLAEDYIDEK